ncbi:lipase family protein [Erwinia billingiae]|uniref:lipase family protein n=1 Tax=Erwinia billingiae TaxID=182337 RepID=UPI00124413ED|nr:lipase family protein [Erwinia billingiae]QEW33885.1 lipase family protein [Erwinia billingiae]
MNKPATYTSVEPECSNAFTCQQKEYWIEIQLVDEMGKAVSGLTYTVQNDATRSGHLPAYTGSTDGEGLIRISKLHWLNMTLTVEAQSLADEMQQRPLAISRPPRCSATAGSKNTSGWRSNVQIGAEQKGYQHHYVTIGELCDSAPKIEKWEAKQLPQFHFPAGKSLKGFEIAREQLEKRLIIEICPFRAWVLVLHDTKEYSLANGYNLGLMADMAYAEKHVVESFFLDQCLDLSVTPRHEETPAYPHALAVDVPFDQRYTTAEFMDTKAVSIVGETKPRLDSTQLFFVECANYLIVAWRGTQEGPDWATDASFIPDPCPPELADAGSIHSGFLNAYRLAKNIFEKKFKEIESSLDRNKKLFICGHSLGGALGLTYGAEMKSYSPIFYSYGMPRTFTANAIGCMHQITHFRHVNDTDTIPSVPFDANLDNWLYGKFGYLGNTLGFFWVLLAEMPAQMMGAYIGEHYWHHGKPVVFFRTAQSVSYEECRVMMNPNTCRRMSYGLPLKAKLFLVPSLSESDNQQAKQAQVQLAKAYSAEDMQRIFPRNTNPAFDHITNPMRHSMASEYLPFLNNQLLESAWPQLVMQRKKNREAFQHQMEKFANQAPKEELMRNKIFLDLQNMLSTTLDITHKLPGGENALIRFKSVSGEEVEII